MAEPFKEPLPPDHLLSAGYSVRLAAIDPTTGNDVSGVVISDAVLFVRNVGSGRNSDLEYGPFMLVPGPGA